MAATTPEQYLIIHDVSTRMGVMCPCVVCIHERDLELRSLRTTLCEFVRDYHGMDREQVLAYYQQMYIRKLQAQGLVD